MHRRREKKSASATTSSSSSSYYSSDSASDTDHQQQHPQIHVYQPRLSLNSDRVVAGTTLSVSPEDAGDTELEPLPKYQQQEPEHQAPTIIIDLANLEPGQPQPHQQPLATGRTSSFERGDINNNSSGRSSSSTRGSSSNRGHGHPTLEGAESDPRRTSWEDVETGIVPEYSQVTAAGHTAAERSASVLLPSPTTTRTTSDDHNHVHNRDSGTPPAGGSATPSNASAVTAAADNAPGSIEPFVPASEPTSAPPSNSNDT
ncbi:hypothetical protein BGZ68_004402 [Mortierella alpina]|nr:hypothetical protein BGZ68_004402 [Mortierella alpina]